MKNLLLITALISSIATSSFAKTEGDYLGIYGILAKVNPDDSSSTSYQVSEEVNRKIRLGFNYQHAFNFNNFFISPEVFIDALELANESQTGDKLTISNRYGVKANIGYDIGKKFSPYITIGHSIVEYSSKKLDNSFNTIKTVGTQGSAIYGFGANIKIHESLTAILEYNKQTLMLSQGYGDGLGEYKADINSIKFGVAYNF